MKFNLGSLSDEYPQDPTSTGSCKSNKSSINQTSIPKNDLHELNVLGLTGLQIQYYLLSFQEKGVIGKKS